MAVIVDKSNPYTNPQSFQLRQEDFTSLVVPYSVEGRIVDIVNKRIFSGRIYVDADGKIERIEERDDIIETSFLIPGLVDSHVHVESSMLMPSEFARAAVRHGVVASVCDPHEIANVLGTDGLHYFIKNGKESNYKFFFGAPSCVPATKFETAGATIGAKEIEELMKDPDIYFLGEMMNFPGVIHNDPEVYAKLKAAQAVGKPIDGHAPSVTGKDLKIYVGAGISTDHECMNLAEAEEKLALGMKVLIREGSAAKNFDNLYSLIDKYPDQVMLCTDDAHPDNLLEGYINKVVERGLNKGLNLYNLLRAACLNPILHYNLPVGLLREGDPADFIVVNSIDKFELSKTYINGKLVYNKGEVYLPRPAYEIKNKFEAECLKPDDLIVEANSEQIKVIGVIDKELYTRGLTEKAKNINNNLVADVENDILKIVVLNRYQKHSKPAIAFIKGFGLKKGAICSTVAHDSHNVIAVGTNDADLLQAINAVIENKGGISTCCNSIVTQMPLPIAGIISDESIEKTATLYKKMDSIAKENLGSILTAPFMTLAFMALIVIPELKLCDKGLFDVKKFNFTQL